MKESMQTGNGFDMLCEHTKRVLETEELEKISAAKLKRWADLASIWYNNQEKLGLDVFYPLAVPGRSLRNAVFGYRQYR